MKKEKTKNTSKKAKKLSVFDHVKEIRQIQDPDYYINLSENDKATFNLFIILRALSMDSELVEDMASLYQYLDKIPPAQFYTLLIAMVPKSNRFYPWVKSKSFKHKQELIEVVAKRFQVSKRQANAYINILIKSNDGQNELVEICQAFGLTEDEINKLFEPRTYET